MKHIHLRWNNKKHSVKEHVKKNCFCKLLPSSGSYYAPWWMNVVSWENFLIRKWCGMMSVYGCTALFPWPCLPSAAEKEKKKKKGGWMWEGRGQSLRSHSRNPREPYLVINVKTPRNRAARARAPAWPNIPEAAALCLSLPILDWPWHLQLSLALRHGSLQLNSQHHQHKITQRAPLNGCQSLGPMQSANLSFSHGENSTR